MLRVVWSCFGEDGEAEVSEGAGKGVRRVAGEPAMETVEKTGGNRYCVEEEKGLFGSILSLN